MITQVKFNLVLVHTPGRQDIGDFLTIRNILTGRAPDIAVAVLSAGTGVPRGFWERSADRPTLVFSPMPVELPGLRRGTVMAPRAGASKMAEHGLLKAHGFPTPDACLVTPELTLAEADWGPFTVLKPDRGMRGQGVGLVRTRDVRWTDPMLLPPQDPRYGQEMVAQRFVDTGLRLQCYRVMTVLGEAAYALLSRAKEPRAPLSSLAARGGEMPISANGAPRTITLAHDQDVVDLAMAVHRALPEEPVLGLDIVREEASGALFVLELNSGGLTWHLSSDHGLAKQRENAIDFYGQFDALGTIANALIRTVRERAR